MLMFEPKSSIEVQKKMARFTINEHKIMHVYVIE